LIGSLIVVLTIVLAVLGVVATMRQLYWLGPAVFVVAALAVGVQTWQAMSSYGEEQQVRRRVTEAIEFLIDEADSASQLEYKMRGDPRPDTTKKLAEYVAEIERWRARTSNGLKEKFPKTGADRLFLGAVGDVGLVNVPVTSRKIYYEYTRLRHCQTALFAILASVDAFVRREQLVWPSQTVAASKEKATDALWPPSSDALLALSTLALALFTLALVVVSVLQRRTLDATLESNRIIERAYVGLSHTPPGLQPLVGPPPTAQVEIRVKNHGSTPAKVTGMSLTLFINPAPLPTIPPYAPGRPAGAFLTTGDEFFVPLPITTGQFAQIQAGTPAYVLCYVDYQDQFGQGHRHRYARRYDAQRAGGNLVFVTEAGYNDDLPL